MTTTDAETSERSRWRDPGTLAFVLPLIVYLLLSIGGITTSNIGANPLRQDPQHPTGIEFGQPQPVRSDEFMTDSPISLGWIASGGRGIDNPLNISPNVFQQLPSGPVSSLVFLDGTFARLGPVLPDALLFAGKWWLPTLLLFLGLPAWFRQITGSRRWGYLACVLMVFAPASAWWSGWPLNTLGFISAAMALLIHAHRRFVEGRRVEAVGAALLSAVLMARFPTYYQPYAIVLGFPLLIGTLVFLLRQDGPLKPKLLSVGVAGGLGAILTAGTMLESLSSIRTGLDTVYPGQRTSTGISQPFGKVFGATDLGFLRHTQEGLVNNNASEVSSAFGVLFLVAVALWIAAPWQGTRAAHGVWLVVAGLTTFWLAWCTVDFGPVGEHLPLINLVPAGRAANVVGFPAILAFCLLMAQWRPGELARRASPAAALLAGGVSLYAGSSLRAMGMPLLTLWMVWLSSAAVAVVVFALVRWPNRILPLVGAIAAAAAVTAWVNPIEIGLADLRGSTTSHVMLAAAKTARANGELWASDTPAFDALMFATATPALSSRQQLGPNRSEWLKLDPDGSHEDMWNRGGTYIRFAWAQVDGIAWALPTTDQVVMTTSPCTLKELEPELGHIVSSHPLDLPCVTLERRLRWSGTRQFVYEVTSPAP